MKNTGGSWFNVAHNTTSGKGRNPVKALTYAMGRDLPRPESVGNEQFRSRPSRERVSAGIKQAGISGTRRNGMGDSWFQDGAAKLGSKSSARKFASAMIAKIPFPLSRHIAAYWKPQAVAA